MNLQRELNQEAISFPSYRHKRERGQEISQNYYNVISIPPEFQISGHTRTSQMSNSSNWFEGQWFIPFVAHQGATIEQANNFVLFGQTYQTFNHHQMPHYNVPPMYLNVQNAVWTPRARSNPPHTNILTSSPRRVNMPLSPANVHAAYHVHPAASTLHSSNVAYPYDQGSETQLVQSKHNPKSDWCYPKWDSPFSASNVQKHLLVQESLPHKRMEPYLLYDAQPDIPGGSRNKAQKGSSKGEVIRVRDRAEGRRKIDYGSGDRNADQEFCRSSSPVRERSSSGKKKLSSKQQNGRILKNLKLCDEKKEEEKNCGKDSQSKESMYFFLCKNNGNKVMVNETSCSNSEKTSFSSQSNEIRMGKPQTSPSSSSGEYEAVDFSPEIFVPLDAECVSLKEIALSPPCINADLSCDELPEVSFREEESSYCQPSSIQLLNTQTCADALEYTKEHRFNTALCTLAYTERLSSPSSS